MRLFPFSISLQHSADSQQLHGDAKTAASKAGVKGVEVSISHSDTQAIAVALSRL